MRPGTMRPPRGSAFAIWETPAPSARPEAGGRALVPRPCGAVPPSPPNGRPGRQLDVPGPAEMGPESKGSIRVDLAQRSVPMIDGRPHVDVARVADSEPERVQI